jgi:uncharacterized protein DUF1573
MRLSPRFKSPLWLAAVALAALAVAQGCKKENGSESALVVTPDPIEFGEVRWGDTAERQIRIRNRSSHPVTLKDPELDCPCFTLARPPDVSRLEPGQSISLTVVLRSALAKGGLTKKTLVVTSDDPVKPRVDVPVLATVLLVRTIEPQSADFGLVDALGDPVERTIRVRGHRDFHVRVARATLSPTDRPVDVEVRPAADGGDGNDLVLKSRKGAKGLLSGQLSLDMEVTDGKGEKRTYREEVRVQGEAR